MNIHSMKKVAIIFGGQSNHALETSINIDTNNYNYQIKNIDYCKEYYEHIIEPMSINYEIYIFVSCFSGEEKLWEQNIMPDFY